MKETMDTYIRESEEALLHLLNQREQYVLPLIDAYQKVGKKDIRLIASGSSYNASLCARYYMAKHLNRYVHVISPDAFVHYENQENTFDIVISQSGSSTNAIAALDKIKGQNRLAIGLTGVIDSAFRDHADLLFDYGVGEEKVGYVTKGVVTLVLFLDLFSLVCAFKEGRLDPKEYLSEIENITSLIRLYPLIYKKTQQYIQDNFSLLTSMHQAYVLGNHTAYGIAKEAALKIGETVCIPSSAHETEEFLHGPNLQLTPNYSVFMIDGHDTTTQRTKQIFEAVSAVCERCFYVGIGKETKDVRQLMLDCNVTHDLLPFVYLQVFQSIAYQVTESLHRWEKHPVFAHFREKIQYKVKR